MKGKYLFLSVMVSIFLAAGSTFAHHAGSNYDRDHPITISGTVTAYVYTNPHVRIDLDVKDKDGVVSNWTAEMGPPHGMFKRGWNRLSLKPGDPIKVEGFPSKDGKKLIDTLNLEGPGGLVLKLGPKKDE